MTDLDHCPFCGCDILSIKTEPHRIGTLAQVTCNHCCASGGSFVEFDTQDAIEQAAKNWNQKNLRPNTFCDKVKRFLTQLEYDIRTFRGRY
jgi:hypothetical protein